MPGTAGDGLRAALPSFPSKDLSAFHVESLLGGGGFSHVVLARDAAGAEWALKLIPARGATCLDDVDSTPLLLSEARIHLLLSAEPSVLPCMEAFKSVYVNEGAGGVGAATYMAVLRMPVAACSVEEWLFSVAPIKPPCQGPPQLQVNEEEVLGVWLQMVNAVHRCHMHGVIHKDIKLPNFLMDARGKVQIMDFGLAQVEGVTPRLVVGTPWTMSPTALKHGDDGRAGDWWSLGIVLYQLVQGGAWPFKQCWWPWQKGGGERMEAAIRRAVLAGRISFRDSAAVSEPIKQLIRGLLQPDPNRRWQLRQVLASEAVRPELLRRLADRFPELRRDMEELLQIQTRARDVVAIGYDGGTAALATTGGGAGIGGGAGSVVAAAASNLLHRGAAAVSAVAGEGGLHWPGGLRPGRAHGGGEGSYRPLLGHEDGSVEKGDTVQDVAPIGGAPRPVGPAPSRLSALTVTPTAGMARGNQQPHQQPPPQQQQQQQQQQQPQNPAPVRVDDLLFLPPDEVPRTRPSPSITQRADATATSTSQQDPARPSGRAASPLVPGLESPVDAVAGHASSRRVGEEGPSSTSGSQTLTSNRTLSGQQLGSPLALTYRASPRGSLTSLQDLFGTGSGQELPQPQQQQPLVSTQKPLEQLQQRSSSGGLLGGLLGSAADLIVGGRASQQQRGPALRRHSWALQWQPTPLLQQQPGTAECEGGESTPGRAGADEAMEPLQLPTSSWVPPPPEVFASGKFDRRIEANSPVRLSGGASLSSPPVGTAEAAPGRTRAAALWQGASPLPSPSPGARLLVPGLSPSRRLLVRARMLFTDCLRRPGVKHELDDEEYDSLAAGPR